MPGVAPAACGLPVRHPVHATSGGDTPSPAHPRDPHALRVRRIARGRRGRGGGGTGANGSRSQRHRRDDGVLSGAITRIPLSRGRGHMASLFSAVARRRRQGANEGRRIIFIHEVVANGAALTADAAERHPRVPTPEQILAGRQMPPTIAVPGAVAGLQLDR